MSESGPNQALVTVALESLTQSPGGAIFGEIAVRVAEKQFPGPGWNDFIVVVLGWWSEQCTGLLRGSNHAAELRFMDGPFFMILEVTSSRSWTVQFLCRRAVSGPAMTESQPAPGLPNNLQVAPLAFSRSLALRGREVLHECSQHSWEAPEVDSLTRENDALRAQLGM
jgi:hypothetical protein